MNITNESVQSVKSVAKSFHHRMARLIRDAFAVRCELPGCETAASYVCEYDHQRSGRMVSGRKLYCPEHAANFAGRHNIYLAGLPDVRHSQLETASRDDWRYSDDLTTKGTKKHEDNSVLSVLSVPSVAQNNQEEH